MSLTVSWGEEENESRPLSTGAGWGAFGAWADALDPKTFREVVHLWEHGYTTKVRAFIQQLDVALSQHPPKDHTVHDTAEGLLRAARDAKSADHLAVDNGMGPDDGGDEWDEDAANYDPQEPPAPVRESVELRERQSTPPHPGEVFNESTHRWEKGSDDSSSNHGTKLGDTSTEGPEKLSAEDEQEIHAAIDGDDFVKSAEPKPGVLQKIKVFASDVMLRANVWVDRLTHSQLGALAGVGLDGFLDNPEDMKKFGYNPANTAQTASPQTADFVKSNLTDEFGFGVSGHLVAKIAATVITRAIFLIKAKLAGTATAVKESIQDTDGAKIWGEFIAGLVGALDEQFGSEGSPSAEEVTGRIRELTAGTA